MKLNEIKTKMGQAANMGPGVMGDRLMPKGEMVGIEMEFLFGTREAAAAFNPANIKVPGIALKRDGSIHATAAGQATYAYAQEANGLFRVGQWARLYAFCSRMQKAGAIVNRTCGLHVHLDTRDTDRSKAQKRARRLKAALPLLLSLVPQSRRENTFCKPSLSYNDRYNAINGTTIGSKGTIEIRLHSGSLDADKIVMWVRLLLFISRRSIRKGAMDSIEALLASDVASEVKLWAVERYRKFNQTAPVGQSAEADMEGSR